MAINLNGSNTSRDSSLTDKFFTGEDNTDFGLNSSDSSTLSANTDGSFGLQSKD